jgi:hypothetical protein
MFTNYFFICPYSILSYWEYYYSFLYISAYPAAMPQCWDAASAAFSNKDSPTKETVGTIVNGVTNFKKYPTIPAHRYNFNILR